LARVKSDREEISMLVFIYYPCPPGKGNMLIFRMCIVELTKKERGE